MTCPDEIDVPEPPMPPALAVSVLADEGEGERFTFTYRVGPLVTRGVLSPREEAVLGHLLAGCRTDEIAALHGRSINTVSNQIRSIFRKFGASSRVELAARLAREAR